VHNYIHMSSIDEITICKTSWNFNIYPPGYRILDAPINYKYDDINISIPISSYVQNTDETKLYFSDEWDGKLDENVIKILYGKFPNCNEIYIGNMTTPIDFSIFSCFPLKKLYIQRYRYHNLNGIEFLDQLEYLNICASCGPETLINIDMISGLPIEYLSLGSTVTGLDQLHLPCLKKIMLDVRCIENMNQLLSPNIRFPTVFVLEAARASYDTRKFSNPWLYRPELMWKLFDAHPFMIYYNDSIYLKPLPNENGSYYDLTDIEKRSLAHYRQNKNYFYLAVRSY
jgi:hypothetical protein